MVTKRRDGRKGGRVTMEAPCGSALDKEFCTAVIIIIMSTTRMHEGLLGGCQ